MKSNIYALGHFSSKMNMERPLQSMAIVIGNISFQQDGATCHTAKATLDVLRPVFEDRIISRLSSLTHLGFNFFIVL